MSREEKLTHLRSRGVPLAMDVLDDPPDSIYTHGSRCCQDEDYGQTHLAFDYGEDGERWCCVCGEVIDDDLHYDQPLTMKVDPMPLPLAKETIRYH